MKEFATVMGLQFNAEKSGCIRVSQKVKGIPPVLPQGDVRWGFLKLDPTGYFTLDHALIDIHIDRLISQLASSKSLFSWIRT